MPLLVALLVCIALLSVRGLRPTRPTTRLLAKGRADVGTEGYSPFGSLTRQGPVPFFIRLVNPDTYNAAVEKYMAQEGCDRTTAMANMDAYFQDPNGWAGKKLRAKREGTTEQDDLAYINANQDPSSLVLTGTWAVGILGLFWRIFQVQVLEK